MAQRAAQPPDLTPAAVNLARAISLALRSWALYPPEHPAVTLAVDRLAMAITSATAHGAMDLAVTPPSLLLDGLEVEAPDLSVSDCAALLHDRDILRLAFLTAAPESIVRSLLTVLTMDRDTRRARGGPAAVWLIEGDRSILIEQIDYLGILERAADASTDRRDVTWTAIVRSIILGRRTFSAEEQQRLLDISRDVGAIDDLARDARAPFFAADGSPLITTQAATVLAVYRHIAQTVSALEPDRASEVMASLAVAATMLDPATVFALLDREESPGAPVPFVDALTRTFDDRQVALLLARALSTPGNTTSRLAQVLDTLAPDEARRQRVLTLAGRLINERASGHLRPIDDIRQSLDELLLKYDETSYVSGDYRSSMDQATLRAADLAARGLPPEMDAWLATIGHESVRRLSGQLLVDLLKHEGVDDRIGRIAGDLGAFVEDLMLAGAFGESLPLIEALAEAQARPLAGAGEACRAALESVGESSAFAEAATTLGEQNEDEYAEFASLASAVGPSVVAGLLAVCQREDAGVAAERASAIMVRLGPAALPHLAAAVDDSPWFVQRQIARVLGRVGTAAAVPTLHRLLRNSDLRVVRAAVSAVAGIDDALAARSLHTVLAATTGATRAVVIEALVGQKDARIVPMLARILQDSDPFGDDYALVIDTLGALASIQDERALPQIMAMARRRSWLAWGKTHGVRAAALRAIIRLDSPRSRDAVGDLARTGDFFLRRLAAATAIGKARG